MGNSGDSDETGDSGEIGDSGASGDSGDSCDSGDPWKSGELSNLVRIVKNVKIYQPSAVLHEMFSP